MIMGTEELRRLVEVLHEQSENQERRAVLHRIGMNPTQRKRPSAPPRLRVVLPAPLLRCEGFERLAMTFYPTWTSRPNETEEERAKCVAVLRGDWSTWLKQRCDCDEKRGHDCALRYEQPDYHALYDAMLRANDATARRCRWYLRAVPESARVSKSRAAPVRRRESQRTCLLSPGQAVLS